MSEPDNERPLICGHCKVMCMSMEELSEHMKAEHITQAGQAPVKQQVLTTSAADSLPVTDDMTPRQTVVVYKQNADGSTTNTGQVVQLTQTQILQLLNMPNAELQRPEETEDEQVVGELVQEMEETTTAIGDDVAEQIMDHSSDHMASNHIVQTASLTNATTVLPLSTNKGRKQLVVLGPENTERINKISLALSKAYGGKNISSRAPVKSSHEHIKIKEANNAAGIPSLVSKEFIQTDEMEEGLCEIRFQFNAADAPEYLEDHIRPVASFKCQYCNYSDPSYKRLTVHVKNFHINDDGTVNKQLPLPWTSSTNTAGVNSNHTEPGGGPSQPSDDELSCPFCLTRFLTADDRDFHRLKKCGPKQRYEVKRTAVRTLNKHLMCADKGCGRALYFSDHLMAIKHPRATFGACHRNNGQGHYFSCYICAAKQPAEWKKQIGKQVEGKVAARMRAVSNQLDLAAAKKQDMEVDTVLNETVELSLPADREKMVELQAMKSWDFTTWKQCSEHLVSEHKDSILLPPKCGICIKAINCCNDMCAHVFNSEVEYIDNCVLNLKRRLSKKMIKKGNVFGITKDFAADKMLFTDISNDMSATFNPHTEDVNTPIVSGVNLYSSRSKRYICRTCGMGFSTATRRDKHVYSNTCVKEQVEKKFSCSVCSRRFITRRMLVNHETWCLYKDKRDKLLAAEEQRSAAEAQLNNENENPAAVSADGDTTVDSTSAIDSTSTGLDSSIVIQDNNLKPKTKRKRATDFRCNILGCSIGFSSETEKDVHLKCHVNNSITYKCCFCEYSPNVSINWYPLKEHIIAKHPGHIPPEFECNICNKGFAKLSKYEEHAIKHSSVKSHTCIECGVKFKQETGLRTHVQFEHGTDEAKEYAREAQKGRMANIPTVSNATLLCYVCGYSTTSRSYYKTHMNIHKGVKPYSCKFCDYSSVDSTCFKRHMWRHQEKKPYKCAYCPFDGIQRSQIIAHMKSKHNVWPEDARKLITHISGRASHNPKGTAGSNSIAVTSATAADDVELSAASGTIHVEHQLVSTTADGTLITTSAADSAVAAGGIEVVDTSGGVVTQGEDVEGTTTATVSIVNPDGSETQIPVELITQAAQGLAAGTNVQVAYGDYMINYMLEKTGEGSEDERTEDHMDTTTEAVVEAGVETTQEYTTTLVDEQQAQTQ